MRNIWPIIASWPTKPSLDIRPQDDNKNRMTIYNFPICRHPPMPNPPDGPHHFDMHGTLSPNMGTCRGSLKLTLFLFKSRSTRWSFIYLGRISWVIQLYTVVQQGPTWCPVGPYMEPYRLHYGVFVGPIFSQGLMDLRGESLHDMSNNKMKQRRKRACEICPTILVSC